jgi:uncharacterized membrane protein
VGWTAGVSLVAVVVMAFLLPMGDALDEAEHAYRIYQLSIGRLYPQWFSCVAHPGIAACTGEVGRLVPHRRVGGRIDASLFHVLYQLSRWSQTRQGTHFNPHSYTDFAAATLGGRATNLAHFENTALYSPLNYVPQIVVFWVARHLTASVLTTLFAARLVSGLVWAALVTWSVALMRRWRWLWSVAVLVPTALAQGATFSSDSLVLGVVAVAIAYALRLADAGAPLRLAQWARLSILGLALGLLKFPVPLVSVAIAVIVWPVIGSGRARGGALAVLLVPCVAAAAWWNVKVNSYFLPYRNTVFDALDRRYISPPQQIHHVLTHLIDVPGVLWNTLADGRLVQVDGLVATYGTLSLSGWFAVPWLAAFAALVAITPERAGLSRRNRVALGGALVLIVIATAMAQYLTWNGVGAATIQGVQGRYFAPLLVLLLPLLVGAVRLRRRPPEWVPAVAAMTITAVGAVVLFEATAWSYYHQPVWQVVPRVASALL